MTKTTKTTDDLKNVDENISENLDQNIADQIDEIEENPDSQLEGKVKDLSNQLEAMTQKWARSLADYQNLERNSRFEREGWIKFGNEKLLRRLIEALDNLDRALQYVKDAGMMMVRNDFRKILEEFGVNEIDCLGKDFDPQTMECLGHMDGDKEKVSKIESVGYQWNEGKVLRPAKVLVGNGEKHKILN